MENDKLEQKIEDTVKGLLKSGLFTDRKLTDNPTDDLQVANRRYVTLNGTTANRPISSVVGQSYFDTTINKPVWYNGTAFVDATGTVV